MEEAWMTMESLSNEPPPEDPSITQRIVGNLNNAANEVRILNFVMLGCEPRMPYGPIDHTAQLLADLLGMAAAQSSESCLCWIIRIKSYNVQEQDYPDDDDWDSYDGVLVPGSFASAYNTTPWIERLKQVLQDEIVAKQRPTLAVCFGHQILAHSFPGGQAVATPTGPRAGHHAMKTTDAGAKMLQKPSIDLYYTHGDMVDRLPETAVSLGGNDQVPIQSAAYFSSSQEAIDWCRNESATATKPYAITFQAHPEYATSMDLGVYRTLHLCMDAMEQKGGITKERRIQAGQDASARFAQVQQDSIDTMVEVGRLLGWFPERTW